MRQLRYLKPGDDGSHVIVETADGAEQFLLHIDVPLRDAVRADLPRLHPNAPEPQPSIGPREIQVRVRGGESPRELAEAHGMTLERVLRFALPVLEERGRIADEARRAKARRSTTEGQTVIFGEAVDSRFGAHGIDPTSVTWDARRRDDGQWVVTASWLGGGTQRVAEWHFHLSGRAVTPLDDTAADLLSDRPIRPVVSVVEPPERPSLAAAPPLVRGVVAFPVMGEPASAAHPAEEVFDQDAADHPADHSGHRGSHQGAAPHDLTADDDAELSAPPLPLRLAEPPAGTTPNAETSRLPKLKNLGVAARDEESDEDRAARARIPSWDDILLGVRRKRD
jgi:hypothetical protein